MCSENIETVTVGEFLDSIRQHAAKLSYDIEDCDWPGAFYDGAAEHVLERKHAAILVHEFLLKVLHEKDEEDISASECLEDLYECRVCASHIAQVYCKGIIKSKINISESCISAFCLNEGITRVELQEIIDKVFDKETRVRPHVLPKENAIIPINVQEAIRLKEEKSIPVIDIRSRAEYDLGHLKGSVCVPMDELIRNPYCISSKITCPVILYCSGAERCNVAAQCMKDAGFKRVYIFNDKHDA